MEISYRIAFVYIVKLCFCSVKLSGCLATDISLQNKSEHYCSVSDMILIQKQPGSLKETQGRLRVRNNVLAFTPALFQEIQFHFIQLYKS